MDAGLALELADWRRRVGELYERVRTLGGGEQAWLTWREGKQSLYRDHAQSPVPESVRAAHVFGCFDHDPSMRVLADLEPTAPYHVDGDGEVPGMTRIGTLHFALHGEPHELGAWWLDGYAGGLFVPFTDATSGAQTYGGGRYAIDTAKGADLGTVGDRVVLDFNYAYAPSCAHDARWRCPLAAPGNRLSVPIRAGETGP